MENKKKLAITYSRCSTSSQDLISMNKRLESWANGFDERNHYEDMAVSGKKDSRKGINSLLQFVESIDLSRYELVLVGIVELSRIGRSISFIHRTVEQLSNKGIKIVLVNSGMILDYKTLEGRALIGGLALAADIEWMLISERNQRGRDKIRDEGIQTGRKKKNLSIDAIKALREKVNLKTGQKYSYRDIAEDMNTSPATIMRRLKY